MPASSKHIAAITGFFMAVLLAMLLIAPVQAYAASSKTQSAKSTQQLKASNKADKTVTITAKGSKFDKADKVQFAVWSLNGGQDDLVWYNAKKKSDGSWRLNVSIARHKSAGIYYVHAYVTKGKNLKFAAMTSFEVSSPTAEVTQSKRNNSTGSFQITVKPDYAPGVAEVSVPIWSQSNQSDIKWYPAKAYSDGTWRVTVSAKNHCAAQSYKVHVYVTGNNGVFAYAGQTKATLKLKNFVAVSGSKGSGTRTVWVRNPEGANKASVAVWSNANGQDDIAWYDLKKSGTAWKAKVKCDPLRHSGKVNVHVYINDKFLKSATFSAAGTEINNASAFVRKANKYSSATSWLILVDNKTNKTAILNGSKGSWRIDRIYNCATGAPWSPTVKGVYTVQMRGLAFGSSYTCWYWTQFYGDYLFHSVLYNPGSRTSIQDGRLGINCSHGCVRLKMADAKWIHDNIPSGTKVVSY